MNEKNLLELSEDLKTAHLMRLYVLMSNIKDNLKELEARKEDIAEAIQTERERIIRETFAEKIANLI